MIFMLVDVIFLFWIQVWRKLHFTILANPKNPNLNLDCTDYEDFLFMKYAYCFDRTKCTVLYSNITLNGHSVESYIQFN